MTWMWGGGRGARARRTWSAPHPFEIGSHVGVATRPSQVINRPWTMMEFLKMKEWTERITEDYVYIAETDHLLMADIPNRATPKLNVAFFFPYMSPVPTEQVLLRTSPRPPARPLPCLASHAWRPLAQRRACPHTCPRARPLRAYAVGTRSRTFESPNTPARPTAASAGDCREALL